MRTFANLLVTSAAGLLLAAGTAQAGACSGEIMALQKQMEETPTMASSGGTDLGTSLGAAPSAAAAPIGETAHAAPNGSGEAASTPGRDPLPDANGGTLVQNGDAPTPTQPMDADAAAANQLNTATGTVTDAAAQALARARALDQAGDEAACMNAVNEAKSHLGQ
jgi:hypothetical protein